MLITKFGHSCLLIEESGLHILFDPGSYSTLQNDVERVDVILITHEHQDHLHIESLQKILSRNPEAKIFTNSGVGEKLRETNIAYELFEHKQTITLKGVLIEGFGTDHAQIYNTIPIIPNTGYFINNRFFYPGDALNIPDRPVEILAYPAVAPWMKLADALDYGKAVHPNVAFPVHDGFLKSPGAYYRYAESELTAAGIQWVVIEEGKSAELLRSDISLNL